jgi:F-type H+-transporting ATPase subunit gamma
MASLRDIRKRIRSVRNSQKITRAMKLVAASKLRRAQDAMLKARPYAREMATLLSRVAARAATEDQGASHPLLEVRVPKRAMLIVVTSDRGLCGAFNANLLRRADRFIRENGPRFDSLEIATIGKKGRDYYRKRRVATVRDFPGVFENLTFRKAGEIAEVVAREYMGRELDAVYLMYNEFKSAISQAVQIQEILPVVAEELPAGDAVDYIYEPDQEQVLDKLVPRYVATLVWRALLESAASEHGARMTAMDSATRNAKELIDTLTLQYNRARQAAITRELMDIVGGAEALNG